MTGLQDAHVVAAGACALRRVRKSCSCCMAARTLCVSVTREGADAAEDEPGAMTAGRCAT